MDSIEEGMPAWADNAASSFLGALGGVGGAHTSTATEMAWESQATSTLFSGPSDSDRLGRVAQDLEQGAVAASAFASPMKRLNKLVHSPAPRRALASSDDEDSPKLQIDDDQQASPDKRKRRHSSSHSSAQNDRADEKKASPVKKRGRTAPMPKSAQALDFMAAGGVEGTGLTPEKERYGDAAAPDSDMAASGAPASIVPSAIFGGGAGEGVKSTVAEHDREVLRRMGMVSEDGSDDEPIPEIPDLKTKKRGKKAKETKESAKPAKKAEKAKKQKKAKGKSKKNKKQKKKASESGSKSNASGAEDKAVGSDSAKAPSPTPMDTGATGAIDDTVNAAEGEAPVARPASKSKSKSPSMSKSEEAPAESASSYSAGQKRKAAKAEKKARKAEKKAQKKEKRLKKKEIKAAAEAAETEEQTRKRKRDEERPKRPASAWNFFNKEKRAAVKAENPAMTFQELSAKVGELWKAATEEEKAPFEVLAEAETKRYEEQMAAFRAIHGESPKAKKRRTTSGVDEGEGFIDDRDSDDPDRQEEAAKAAAEEVDNGDQDVLEKLRAAGFGNAGASSSSASSSSGGSGSGHRRKPRLDPVRHAEKMLKTAARDRKKREKERAEIHQNKARLVRTAELAVPVKETKVKSLSAAIGKFLQRGNSTSPAVPSAATPRPVSTEPLSARGASAASLKSPTLRAESTELFSPTVPPVQFGPPRPDTESPSLSGAELARSDSRTGAAPQSGPVRSTSMIDIATSGSSPVPGLSITVPRPDSAPPSEGSLLSPLISARLSKLPPLKPRLSDPDAPSLRPRLSDDTPPSLDRLFPAVVPGKLKPVMDKNGEGLLPSKRKSVIAMLQTNINSSKAKKAAEAEQWRRLDEEDFEDDDAAEGAEGEAAGGEEAAGPEDPSAVAAAAALAEDDEGEGEGEGEEAGDDDLSEGDGTTVLVRETPKPTARAEETQVTATESGVLPETPREEAAARKSRSPTPATMNLDDVNLEAMVVESSMPPPSPLVAGQTGSTITSPALFATPISRTNTHTHAFPAVTANSDSTATTVVVPPSPGVEGMGLMEDETARDGFDAPASIKRASPPKPASPVKAPLVDPVDVPAPPKVIATFSRKNPTPAVNPLREALAKLTARDPPAAPEATTATSMEGVVATSTTSASSEIKHAEKHKDKEKHKEKSKEKEHRHKEKEKEKAKEKGKGKEKRRIAPTSISVEAAKQLFAEPLRDYGGGFVDNEAEEEDEEGNVGMGFNSSDEEADIQELAAMIDNTDEPIGGTQEQMAYHVQLELDDDERELEAIKQAAERGYARRRTTAVDHLDLPARSNSKAKKAASDDESGDDEEEDVEVDEVPEEEGSEGEEEGEDAPDAPAEEGDAAEADGGEAEDGGEGEGEEDPEAAFEKEGMAPVVKDDSSDEDVQVENTTMIKQRLERRKFMQIKEKSMTAFNFEEDSQAFFQSAMTRAPSMVSTGSLRLPEATMRRAMTMTMGTVNAPAPPLMGVLSRQGSFINRSPTKKRALAQLSKPAAPMNKAKIVFSENSNDGMKGRTSTPTPTAPAQRPLQKTTSFFAQLKQSQQQ